MRLGKLIWPAAMVVVVVITATVVAHVMRPTPPDLGDANTWMLLKNDIQDDIQVKVYVARRLSTTWDPYDLAQNKIVVRTASGVHEFQWPYNYEYAGSWCEIVHGPNTSIAVVLLAGENVVRVVSFVSGRFSFRPVKDELLRDHELAIVPKQTTDLAFDIREVTPPGGRQAGGNWRWTPETGFIRVATRENHDEGSRNQQERSGLR